MIAFDTLTDRASNLIEPTLPARRHRPFSGRQDRVHHFAGSQPAAWRPSADVFRRPIPAVWPVPRLNAARRRGAAVPVRGSCSRLIEERLWPDSTRAISELRLVIEYESASGWNRFFSGGRLCLDIVDYPGEWLLDLPLLGQDFAAFSLNAASLARSSARLDLATPWLERAGAINPHKAANEADARELARLYTDYLRACKRDERALSTLPPGRS